MMANGAVGAGVAASRAPTIGAPHAAGPVEVPANTDGGWRRIGSIPNKEAGLPASIAMWDRYMDLKYANITVDDLVGENYLTLFTDFCSKMGENPPVKPNGSAYGIASLTKYVRHLILDMKRRHGHIDAIKNGPTFFADNDVSQMLKMLESHHGRTLMIGSKESDVFKESFPIPRKHSQQTILLPFNDFPDKECRVLSRTVDLISMAKTLFSRGEFIKAAKILCTFNGIGRGGEIKFLSYDKMFFCGYFNVLFTQWFQRKELKTNPSGFFMDFDHPELCFFFTLGCYWLVNNGLSQDINHLSDPKSPLFRRAKFVFPDLHEIADASVAAQMTSVI